MHGDKSDNNAVFHTLLDGLEKIKNFELFGEGTNKYKVKVSKSVVIFFDLQFHKFIFLQFCVIAKITLDLLLFSFNDYKCSFIRTKSSRGITKNNCDLFGLFDGFLSNTGKNINTLPKSTQIYLCLKNSKSNNYFFYPEWSYLDLLYNKTRNRIRLSKYHQILLAKAKTCLFKSRHRTTYFRM